MKKIAALTLVSLFTLGSIFGCTSYTETPSVKPTIDDEGAQQLRGQFVPEYDINTLRDYSSRDAPPDNLEAGNPDLVKESQEEERRAVDKKTFKHVIEVIEEAEAEKVSRHQEDPGHYGESLDALGEGMYLAVKDNLPPNEGFQWSMAATDDGEYIIHGWNPAGWAYLSNESALVFSTEKGGFVYKDDTKK